MNLPTKFNFINSDACLATQCLPARKTPSTYLTRISETTTSCSLQLVPAKISPHTFFVMVLPVFHDVVIRRRPTSTRCPNKVLPIIKGCLILAGFVMLASFEVYSLARSVHSSSPSDDGGSNVNACVRKVEQKCMLYPCQDRNGAVEEIAPLSSLPFGYAGNFVRRQGNITKPHELACKQYAASSSSNNVASLLISFTCCIVVIYLMLHHYSSHSTQLHLNQRSTWRYWMGIGLHTE